MRSSCYRHSSAGTPIATFPLAEACYKPTYRIQLAKLLFSASLKLDCGGLTLSGAARYHCYRESPSHVLLIRPRPPRRSKCSKHERPSPSRHLRHLCGGDDHFGIFFVRSLSAQPHTWGDLAIGYLRCHTVPSSHPGNKMQRTNLVALGAVTLYTKSAGVRREHIYRK
jgi:hypothetical protein